MWVPIPPSNVSTEYLPQRLCDAQPITAQIDTFANHIRVRLLLTIHGHPFRPQSVTSEFEDGIGTEICSNYGHIWA